MKLQTVIASAFVLALALAPTVSAQSEVVLLTDLAQSGPPEEPDPNGYGARCHHVSFPNCTLVLYTIDMWLWAANYIAYCVQYPSQCDADSLDFWARSLEMR